MSALISVFSMHRPHTSFSPLGHDEVPKATARLVAWMAGAAQNRWRAVTGDASIMEDKPLLPGSLYWLARLLQEEAYYDVCGKSHLVRVWRTRTG